METALYLRQREALVEALRASNEVTARFGLTLSDTECALLAERRLTALRSAGRVEFCASVLPALAEAFCDSPYLEQRDYAETLGALQELFYELKNEAAERLADDELIAFLRAQFDGPCGGSLEALRDVMLDGLCRPLRFGEEAAFWTGD